MIELLFSEINTIEFAIWIAIASVIGVIITGWRSIDSAAQERKVRFSEMLEKFEFALQSVNIRGNSLKDLEECRRFASDYLNIMERMAYLKKEGKIDKKMIKYFDRHFQKCWDLLEWRKLMEFSSAGYHWPYLMKWIEKKGLVSHGEDWLSDVLPPKMMELYHERIKSKENTSVSDSTN